MANAELVAIEAHRIAALAMLADFDRRSAQAAPMSRVIYGYWCGRLASHLRLLLEVTAPSVLGQSDSQGDE
jgi:hypothetical protein